MFDQMGEIAAQNPFLVSALYPAQLVPTRAPALALAPARSPYEPPEDAAVAPTAGGAEAPKGAEDYTLVYVGAAAAALIGAALLYRSFKRKKGRRR